MHLGNFRFRTSDSDGTRIAKLNSLLDGLEDTSHNRTLYISIVDGLLFADPTEPLLRTRMRDNIRLGVVVADAGNAAAAPAAFRLFKDGVANGTITFTGTVGAAVITDAAYPVGSLLEIYPPLVADATLDDVSISIPVTVS